MKLFLLSFFFSAICLSLHAQDTCATSTKYGSNPAAGGYAAVNGIKMYYEIYGPANAQPLLLIHGNGGSIRSMRCQIEEFRRDYRVIIADSRFHGKSGNGDKPLSYELMADDEAALLNYLHIDSAYVIGQSDGAILTLLMAMNHPRSIKKGIAMAPNLRPDTTALYGHIVHPVIAAYDSLKLLMASGKKDSAVLREYAYYKLMAEEPHISTAALGHIQCPILLMAGDGDAITLEHMVEMYRALPKANLLIMSAMTHRFLREDYRLFNQMCRRFFEHPFSRPETRF